MDLERIPSDIRADGGIARMSDPSMIKEIQDTVSIPVMAKCRIGHFAEAQVLEALGVDYCDESEVLTPADENNHIKDAINTSAQYSRALDFTDEGYKEFLKEKPEAIIK